MSAGKLHRCLILEGAVLSTLLPGTVSACAVCFGDPESAMTHGVNMAIITMGGVTGSVLGGLALFFFHIRKRSNLLGRHKNNGQTIKTKGRWF